MQYFRAVVLAAKGCPLNLERSARFGPETPNRASDDEPGDLIVRTALSRARLELDVAGDTARALSIVDSIPTSAAWLSLFPKERPYAHLAHFYVIAGKFDRARALLADLEKNVPEDYRAHDQWLVKRDRAMLRVAGGDATVRRGKRGA